MDWSSHLTFKHCFFSLSSKCSLGLWVTLGHRRKQSEAGEGEEREITRWHDCCPSIFFLTDEEDNNWLESPFILFFASDNEEWSGTEWHSGSGDGWGNSVLSILLLVDINARHFCVMNSTNACTVKISGAFVFILIIKKHQARKLFSTNNFGWHV